MNSGLAESKNTIMEKLQFLPRQHRNTYKGNIGNEVQPIYAKLKGTPETWLYRPNIVSDIKVLFLSLLLSGE